MADAYIDLDQFKALGLPARALDGFTGDPVDHFYAGTTTVNSYLRGRYQLPLTPPFPGEIVNATAKLAAYSILSVRGFDPENAADVNIRMQYDDMVRWLERLADGKVTLDLRADASPGVHDGGPRVLSRDRNDARRWRTY